MQVWPSCKSDYWSLTSLLYPLLFWINSAFLSCFLLKFWLSKLTKHTVNVKLNQSNLYLIQKIFTYGKNNLSTETHVSKVSNCDMLPILLQGSVYFYWNALWNYLLRFGTHSKMLSCLPPLCHMNGKNSGENIPG